MNLLGQDIYLRMYDNCAVFVSTGASLHMCIRSSARLITALMGLGSRIFLIDCLVDTSVDV